MPLIPVQQSSRCPIFRAIPKLPSKTTAHKFQEDVEILSFEKDTLPNKSPACRHPSELIAERVLDFRGCQGEVTLCSFHSGACVLHLNDKGTVEEKPGLALQEEGSCGPSEVAALMSCHYTVLLHRLI